LADGSATAGFGPRCLAAPGSAGDSIHGKINRTGGGDGRGQAHLARPAFERFQAIPMAVDPNSQPGETIRIAIVDDHQMLVEALTMVVEKEPGMTMVGSVNTCHGARRKITSLRPDALLLDVSLPDGDGLALVPELQRACPEMQILVLTSLADESTLMRAIEAGVSGFVGKHRPVSEVFAAIRQAAEGEVVMPSGLLVGLLTRRQSATRVDLTRAPAAYEPLTPREREILKHTAQGKSGAAIAAELNISLMTVRTHLRNLMAKLNVHSRLEAVAFALREGLIESPG
jgi:DNA-binding NarL/FixJ family response regulator